MARQLDERERDSRHVEKDPPGVRGSDSPAEEGRRVEAPTRRKREHQRAAREYEHRVVACLNSYGEAYRAVRREAAAEAESG